MSQFAVEAHQLVKKFPARPGTGDKNPSPPSPLPEGEGRLFPASPGYRVQS